ncbi:MULTISPECIES: LysR family transcriptional regulator [unclassified Francisella]|uniref:LysR family transcriptional regulator n=1 Tax=unclassified Francisella TaxID=2610885 RepID=UPI002E33A77D|nr:MULTISPECIES: LysR family transcriptional regulator [unclassified Francisella]MED7819942.1 LysR family transcriptional regulator [Francisella sp. 19S2-4]MED7830762.1 LysR family transcriptional regulator [Francisella sp. 19S2-10]
MLKISNPQPSLDHFEVFLTVIEEGSFTNAAKKLGITTAAVSKNIKLLEQQVKTPLILRSTKKMQLTVEGEKLYAQCKNIKRELDIARNMVSAINANPSGTLNIICNPLLFSSDLLAKLNIYTRKYPDVTINIDLTEKPVDFGQNTIDIAFGFNWPPPQHIISRKYKQTHYITCASPNYISHYGEPKTIKDMHNHKLITHTIRTQSNMPVLPGFENTIEKLQPYLYLNSVEAMKECVLQDMGIGQFHDYAVEKELKEGTLVEILKPLVIETFGLCIYYEKKNIVQPKVRKFIDLFFPK